MPGNERWHFHLHGGTILVIRDGREINIKGVPFGPVKEVSNGAENPQAKIFKLYAIQVSSILL